MMCARLLRRAPEAQQNRLYQASEHAFKTVIDQYGRTLQFVLRYQNTTLLVALGTLVLTILLYSVIPKGFFPIQDTGVIQGVSEAPQTVSFQEMSARQQALAKVILQDPAVESLSSFIGIDGTNITLNSGRIQINLKARGNRDATATEVIRRLQPHLADVPGMTLFMQPVQDLSVEDRVSRTQFQYTLEDPSVAELNNYASRMLARLRELPELRDVASDQEDQGARAQLIYDRDTASRLGITPSAIDQTLYNAYGQRQVSTIFTQLNQYHVVLELMPGFQKGPLDLRELYVRTGVGALLALMICRNDFSVIALIGIVLLIGIVKKNAIMMIDFALDAERHEGKPPEEAIYQASLLRFRPIMMTTMAALLAGVPLAFGSGTGSELRRPLGIAIIGGLIFSQALTLYTTPVIYLWFGRLSRRFSRNSA
jgi:multidrug efflux pump subunit AcrB